MKHAIILALLLSACAKSGDTQTPVAPSDTPPSITQTPPDTSTPPVVTTPPPIVVTPPPVDQTPPPPIVSPILICNDTTDGIFCLGANAGTALVKIDVQKQFIGDSTQTYLADYSVKASKDVFPNEVNSKGVCLFGLIRVIGSTQNFNVRICGVSLNMTNSTLIVTPDSSF